MQGGFETVFVCVPWDMLGGATVGQQSIVSFTCVVLDSSGENTFALLYIERRRFGFEFVVLIEGSVPTVNSM